MGGFIKRDVPRVPTTALNTIVNKKAFDAFKDCCKEKGYPMNVVIETFMLQYTNNRFPIASEDICKWKNEDAETETLNTTFNKEIYMNFKQTCKRNGFFVKHVITAFFEKFSSKTLIMEYVDISEINQE